MKDLKWPAVVVIVCLMVILGWLSYQGKDATTVLAGIIAVLGALGFGYQFSKTSEIQQATAKIEENTNGRMGELAKAAESERTENRALVEKLIRDQQANNDQHRRDMKEMADKLAMMTPPAELPVSVSGGETRPPNL